MSTPEVIGIVVTAIVAAVAVLIVLGRKRTPVRFCLQCKRKLLPSWDKCMFCGWAPGARLEFIAGPLNGQHRPLGGETTTLGSQEGSAIVLSDPAVSKKHAAIRRASGQFELADLGSTNGTYVNGHKLPKKVLVPGDIIRIGNSEAIFRTDS